MLRALIPSILGCLSFVCHASEDKHIPVYKEPDEQSVQQSSDSVHQALKEAERLDVRPDILKMVDNLSTLEPQQVQQHANFTLPEFYQLGRQHHYLEKAYGAAEKINPQEINTPMGQLLVLVSFSMPDALLKQLLLEARRIGARVILRGLVENDIQKTYQKIRALMDHSSEKNIGLMIDPTLFERFSVQQVPTFILALEEIKPCSPQLGCLTPPYIKASGVATLQYFIELVERSHAKSEAQTTIASLLAKYKEK